LEIRPPFRLARRWSLRAKITAWFFVPTAVILVIVAWATFYAYQRLTEELVIERDLELTRLVAGELNRELYEYFELLSLVARDRDEQVRESLSQSIVSEQADSIIRLRGETGRAYLVDNDGRIIYHLNDADRFGEDVSALPVVQRVLAGETGALRTRDADGQEIVASFAPVPGSGWGFIHEESWEELIRSSQGYQRALFLLLALGVATPAIAIAVGVRRITQPIAELISAAQEVAGGNFDQTITAATGDELEDLAEQFNRMAAQLQESYKNLERKVADRTRELAALNAIAASVNESLDLDQTLDRALDEMLYLLGLDVGEIRLLDDKENELVIRAQRGLGPDFVRQNGRCRVAETLPGRVLLSGQMVVLEDMLDAPQYTWMRREGVRSIAICPLQTEDKRLGTLSLATRRGPHLFSQNERELLRAVSDQVGVAIEKARLFEVEQRRAEQFRVISEVGRRITSILAEDELLEEIVRLVKESLGYYLVGIGLIEGDEVVIRAGSECASESQLVSFELKEAGIVSWVARNGEPLLVPDVTQEPRYHFLPQASQTRSELAVPLKTKNIVIGVLDVQSNRLNAFDEKDLTVLQSLAHQAAIAIENARLYHQARQLAVMEERNRLARDLHDSVTQSLYGVTLFAEAAERLLMAGDVSLAADHIRELRLTAQESLREMRLLIFELRPLILGEHGLAAALQVRLESVEGRSGLETVLEVEGEDHRLPAEIEGGLYRIAQEALNNALKHAQAHQVKVYLRWEPVPIVLEISDDGVGFDPTKICQQGGLGLPGMEERATQLGCQLSIQSQPGQGTRVRVEVQP
jgi:nitrate/nitrite-specific signal transduction histidine kinase